MLCRRVAWGFLLSCALLTIAPGALLAECAQSAACTSVDEPCIGELVSEDLLISAGFGFGVVGLIGCELHMCTYGFEDPDGNFWTGTDFQWDCGLG